SRSDKGRAMHNLPADTVVSTAGIYVVSHDEPAHNPPHEVLVAIPMILPKCKICDNVRFSLKTELPERITENPFFRPEYSEPEKPQIPSSAGAVPPFTFPINLSYKTLAMNLPRVTRREGKCQVDGCTKIGRERTDLTMKRAVFLCDLCYEVLPL